MKGIIISEIASYNNGVKRTILKTFSGLGDQMYRWWSNQGDKMRISSFLRTKGSDILLEWMKEQLRKR